MKKTKMEKGITLVALIITIVVLLILAVVAITSIQNAGILEHANNAANQYNQKQDEENGLLNNYEGYLNNYGSILEVDLMKRYVLGTDKKGREITDIANIEDLEAVKVVVTSFINEESTISDASTSVTFLSSGLGEDNTTGNLYAKYNNKAYRIVVDRKTHITLSTEVIYEPQGKEGTKVGYDSDGDGEKEDWIILTDRNGLLEIISEDAKGSLSLGADDVEIKENIVKYLDLNKDGIPDDLDGDKVIAEDGTDLDRDGTVETDNHDIAIASYNNVITTINSYCDDLVTATDNSGVRSVGGTNNNVTAYNSTAFYNLFNGTKAIPAGDLQYEEDLVKMSYWGIAATESRYWIASRYVHQKENEDVFYFDTRNVDTEGLADYSYIWWFDGTPYHSKPVYPVRPVVINPTNIQY